jgi:hypothetical protein
MKQMSVRNPNAPMELAERGLPCDYLLADDAKLEKMPFSQHAVSQPLPSRDSLGVYHAISRLLGVFETFRADMAKG